MDPLSLSLIRDCILCVCIWSVSAAGFVRFITTLLTYIACGNVGDKLQAKPGCCLQRVLEADEADTTKHFTPQMGWQGGGGPAYMFVRETGLEKGDRGLGVLKCWSVW